MLLLQYTCVILHYITVADSEHCVKQLVLQKIRVHPFSLSFTDRFLAPLYLPLHKHSPHCDSAHHLLPLPFSGANVCSL